MPKRRKASNTLASRVGYLVEEFHDGSVNDAAKALGVAQPTIGRILRGEVTQPRLRLIQRMSEVYGVTLDWLLTGVGNAPLASTDKVYLRERSRVTESIHPSGVDPAWLRKWSIFLRSQFPATFSSRPGLEWLPYLPVVAATRWGEAIGIRHEVAEELGNEAAAEISQVWRKLLTELAATRDWQTLATAIDANQLSPWMVDARSSKQG